MTGRHTQLKVIQNTEEQALRAYFRRLYMIEKYILHVMLDNDIRIQYKLLHAEPPRQQQGRIRFNGGIALGMNPYSRLPSVFYTPLGAVDISKGFSTREGAAERIEQIVAERLGLVEMKAIETAVPGIYQRVFAITKDPYGNPLPKAGMVLRQEADTMAEDNESGRFGSFNAFTLWDKVRLHEEPSRQEQIMLSLPRKSSHIRAVA